MMDPSDCIYDLAGLKICLVHTPKVLAKAIDKAFSLSRTESDTPSIYLKGTIQEDDSFVGVMPLFVRERYQKLKGGGDPIIFFGPNEELALLARGKLSSSYAYSLPPFNHVELFCQKLTDKATPLLFQTVLIPLISELLLKQGKLLMHAGCVATPEGEGIILLGDGGGGKTTTTYAMVREGFHFLSDDLVVASVGQDGSVFEPIYEKINITKKTIEFFPELRFLKKPLRDTKEKKIPVDPKRIINPQRLKHTAQAAAILFISLDQRGPALWNLEASSLLNPLLKSNTFANRDGISKQSVEKLLSLLDQTVSYQLKTGSNPETLGKWLARKAAGGDLGKPSQALAKRNFSQIQKKRSVHRKRAGIQKSYREYHVLLQALLEYALDGKDLASTDIGDLISRIGKQEFISWLTYHRLEVYLAKHIVDSDITLDAAPAIDFKSQLSRAKAFFILMLSAAKKVFQQLAAAGIPAIMLRGPALAVAYYPEPFMRFCRDIDIIVQPEHLRDAEKKLATLGFQLRGSREYWQQKGELPFSDGQVTIELHWDAYPVDVAPSFNPDSFWVEPDVINVDGLSVHGLNPSHLLFSSSLHLSYEHKFDRLVRIIDIRQILKTAKDKIDWKWIVAQASESFTRLGLWQALRLAGEIANARVPSDVLRQLAPIRLNEKMVAKIFPPFTLLSTPSYSSHLRRFLFFKLLKPQGK
ncbi:MAG: nucleotidyltransferase domain-containing protein [Planctomycetota bacterium]|jgi:hypothetical protein